MATELIKVMYKLINLHFIYLFIIEIDTFL